MVYIPTEINEIEKIQLTFCKFFMSSTDSAGLEITQKVNNIYNLSEINSFANRELIIKNLLAAKVVMMQEEEGDSNQMHNPYQEQQAQRTRVRRRL